jgi:hypothetical protein
MQSVEKVPVIELKVCNINYQHHKRHYLKLVHILTTYFSKIDYPLSFLSLHPGGDICIVSEYLTAVI